MKFCSPIIVISQLLLVTSVVQAHLSGNSNDNHDHVSQKLSRRHFVDEHLVYAREDVMQSITTRELVAELSARLERRHIDLGSVLSTAAHVVENVTPLGAIAGAVLGHRHK